jgi:hypothetical protein
MKALIVTCLLLVALPSFAQETYQKPTVAAAQEALTRLGYDVGEVDGLWGSKTRAALNELRLQNGLAPADDFVGSSLALIHRLSPGETTLPNPGIVVADAGERRAFLSLPENRVNAANWCPAKVDEVPSLAELLEQDPVAVVSTSAGPKNYISHGDDWMTPIAQTVLGAHNRCIAGDDGRCEDIIRLLSDWAAADALEPAISPRASGEFDNISWMANSLLRSFIFAYADARQLVPVDPAEEAVVLDWLKRRIDQYNYIHSAGHGPGSIRYTEASNHALAAMMPGMAFGALVGDRSMMEGAFETWQLALSEMRPDGSLPTETKRGARSLQYSNFQLAQLISTAEVAQAQGIDLYGQASPEQSIPKAVDFLLDAYEDFDVVAGYAEVNEGSPSDDYTIPYIIQMHFGWMPAYYEQFGADENIDRMSTMMIDPRICSPEAEDENKLSGADRICAGDEPVPFHKVLDLGGGSVGEAANYFMGYPAQCLQGVTRSWPVEGLSDL